MCKECGSFAHRLARGITAVERRHRRFMRHALETEGITGVSYSYVIALHKNPGISQDVLADLQGVDKSRAARIVRKLVDGGFVLREVSPQNRRQYCLRLTKRGMELFGLIMEKSGEWEDLISEGISEMDLTITLDTIGKILRNLESRRM